MTTEIRFFALKSGKQKVLDRVQNGFKCKDKNIVVLVSLHGDYYYYYYCEVGATERGCSGSIGSDDTRGYGAGSGDVGKELPRGMIP